MVNIKKKEDIIDFKKIKTEWNLNSFYQNINDEELKNDIKQIPKIINKFKKKYFKKISKFNEKDFLEFLKEKDFLNKKIEKINLYYFYISSLNTQDQNIIKAESEFNLKITELNNQLLFIEQEIKNIGKEKLIKLSKSNILKDYSNYFLQIANSLKYILSENEEKIINLKEISGVEAFNNLYEELTGSFLFEIEIDGKIKKLTDSEIRSLKSSSNSKIRKNANDAIRRIYNDKKIQITLGNIYNSIVKDWISEIQIRKYSKNVLEQRNISEQIENKTINILIEEVQKAYPIYQKYLKLKAKLLNVKKIKSYDIQAPISNFEKKIPFEKGLKLFLKAIKNFDEEFYLYSKDMFEKGRVDVYPKPFKRSGAFAQYSQGFESYVLLNYTNKIRNVLTLAHELGHAMHGHLSQIQKPEVFDSPISLAETASIFNEMILNEEIYKKLKEKEKIYFLEKRLEDIFATIFKQIQYISFEKKVHQSILNKKELTYIDFNKIWRKEQIKMSANLIEWDVKAEFESSWSMIPHIFRTPFYCYSYAFGNILTFSLYNLYKKEGKKFINKYKNILKAGGSRIPSELLKENGININNREFYKRGIEEITKIVNEFEKLILNKNTLKSKKI